MSKRSFHVVPHEDGWALKEEGRERPVSTFSTQKEAIEEGRSKAEGEDDEVDVVIHRQDGRIRERLTFSDTGEKGGNGRTARARSEREVRPEDIVSVGSRVSWAAMMAGIVVALATNLILGALGAALAATFRNQLNWSGESLAYFATIWGAISLLVSLFLGGYTVSQVTAGETKTEAMLYGVLLWGALLVLIPLLAAIMNAQQVASAVDFRSFDLREYANEISPESRTALAWIGVGGIVLSILASIGGALLGAGPELVFRRLTERRGTTGTRTAVAARD